ncbi:MAG: T9SS type A sorting domain-containing protein [Bacteroidales bacterium]|nr:T9SS type A sorting domain-containing protein [Bacteroidales bacterium]
MKRIVFLFLATLCSMGIYAQNITIEKANDHIAGIKNPSVVANETIEGIALPQAQYIPSSPWQTNAMKKVTMNGKRLLAPGESVIFVVENNTVTEDSAHFGTLGTAIENAIKRVPQWLQYDLRFRFQQSNDNTRSKMVGLINATPKKYLDEVAYVLTYLPKEVLSASRFSDWNQLVSDAAMIYLIADSLKYVRLVESGDTASGDWYTTTEYCIKQGSNYIWRSIDKYYYYEFIVMPKIEQEGVYVTDNLTSITSQRTWGYFWRDYLWNNYSQAVNTADTADRSYNNVNTWGYKVVDASGKYDTIRIDTIPRLGQLMQMPTYLWNENPSIYFFNRNFSASQSALDVLGNWASRCIPQDVTSSEDYRPSQPNHIAWKHVGNCHEDALLVVAAARTALIPCIHVGDFCDDHVWAAIHDGGDATWHHFEFFRGGCSEGRPYYWGMTNMQTNGGYGWNSSLVQGYVPSGYLYNMSATYSQASACTMKLTITDPDGVPVDGARVNLYSTNTQYGTTYIMPAGYLWTNAQGEINVQLGTGKKYYMKIYHPKFGSFPTTSGNVYQLITSANTIAKKEYPLSFRFPSAATSSRNNITSDQNRYDADHSLQITINASNVTTGNNPVDGQQSSFYERTSTAASVNAYVVSEADIANFKSGKITGNADYNFGALSHGTFSIPVHKSGKSYVVLSNNNNYTNYVELQYGTQMVNSADFDHVNIDDYSGTINNALQVYPNPTCSQAYIYTPDWDNTTAYLYDITGKLIRNIPVSNHKGIISMDNLSAGVYIVKCNNRIQKIVKQ